VSVYNKYAQALAQMGGMMVMSSSAALLFHTPLPFEAFTLKV
jgi:hypothetical protein